MSQIRSTSGLNLILILLVCPFLLSACGVEENSNEDIEVNVEGNAMPTKKEKPSTRLSPQAKKHYLKSTGNFAVSGHALISPNTDLTELKKQVENIGGESGAYSETTRQLAVIVGAGQLNKLVDIDGIIYFEAATRYSQ